MTQVTCAPAAAAVRARADALRAGQRDSKGPLSRWFGADVTDPAYGLVREWLDTVDPLGYAAAYHAFATGDLVRALAEELSGHDLGDLFDAWVYGTALPPFPQS